MAASRSIPTLDDVARAAGVSTATVSRCLNTPDRVVEQTRQRVLVAVEELGYTPNFGARAMAGKRTFTIGAIIPTMENAIFARGLQAFQDKLYERGYTLLVASSAYQPDREEEQIRTLVSRGVDGLLLIGYDRDPAIYDYLENQQVAVLIAWTFDAAAPQPSVGFENRAAMTELTREVLNYGHRRIGIISGLRDGNDRVRSRIEGVMDALAEAGLDPDAAPVIQTPYGIENGADAFDRLMERDDQPTAVICVNDVLAVGALQRARSHGLSVPRDVSITGFDDIELARIVTPALTTVHVPHKKMGHDAACALVDIVEKKKTGSSKRLATSVKLRESLGPVAKGSDATKAIP